MAAPQIVLLLVLTNCPIVHSTKLFIQTRTWITNKGVPLVSNRKWLSEYVNMSKVNDFVLFSDLVCKGIRFYKGPKKTCLGKIRTIAERQT
uniref:Uncharacterized protein n=1 Tax=Rhodnius prolixus TaxID=13249 RepID=T1HWE7_RHOPR